MLGLLQEVFGGTLLQPALQSLYQLWLFLTQTLSSFLQNALPWETPPPVVGQEQAGRALGDVVRAWNLARLAAVIIML